MSDEKSPSSILDKVLGYVDSPFKLFAIILMAVITFVGYAIWQNQEFILGAYKEHKKLPTIAEDRVEDAVAHLFKNGAERDWPVVYRSRHGLRMPYQCPS